MIRGKNRKKKTEDRVWALGQWSGGVKIHAATATGVASVQPQKRGKRLKGKKGKAQQPGSFYKLKNPGG